MLTSLQNPKVKQLVAWRRGTSRRQAGVMLIDGFDELSLAVRSGARVSEIYYCPDLMPSDPAVRSAQLQLLERSGVPEAAQYQTDRAVFERIAYREGADGWLAVSQPVSTQLADIPTPPDGLYVLAEAIEKPGNLGAILRTADGAGVTGLLATGTPTDWGNPNIVRSSKGTIFSVPVAEAGLAETLAWLKAGGVRLVAATPAAETLYTEANLTGPIAIAVGTEKYGLTDELMAAADVQVRIPMNGVADSLNVATSAALLVYEAVRQRSL